MVIPMEGMGMQGGTMGEDVIRKLRPVKYSIFLMIGGGILLLFFGYILQSLYYVLIGIMGIMLLRDDPSLAKYYEMLQNSFIGQCSGGGGYQCLMPFMFMCGINAIFDLIRVGQIAGTYGIAVLFVDPATLIQTLILIAEVMCCVITYRLYKSVSAQGGDAMAGGNYQMQGGGNAPLRDNEMGGGGPVGGAPQQQNFEPFQGSGNRLGG